MIQNGADPMGFERVTLSHFYLEGGADTQIGWAFRFDQPVWDATVTGVLNSAGESRSVRSIERRLEMEIWNESSACWEALGVDEFVSGVLGVVHLIRRRGVTNCKDFGGVRDAIVAGMVHVFPLSPLAFYKQGAPYELFQPRRA